MELSASWDEVRRTWSDAKAQKFETHMREIGGLAKEVESLERELRELLDDIPR